MIWIVLGCCWVSQIRTKPTKNIWGPLLDSISGYYVQCPWKIVRFFQVFRHLNYHILVFFPAYIGLYWTPAGWYGQKPYLGPAHMWLWQNMVVCDAELGPKWGGVTNIHFKNFMSYIHRLDERCSQFRNSASPMIRWRSHRGMLVLIHCVILNDAPNDVYLFITSFTVFIYSFVVTYASSHTNSRIRILMENSLIRRPLRSGISP